MLARFRKISLLMAYAVATIPLCDYIRDVKILLLMLLALIFANLSIVLASIEDARAVLSSEKAKMPLPPWLPQNTKYEKWWLIVRSTHKWHLLLVPAKMGLVLGLAEWLYVVPIRSDYPRVFMDLYMYIAHNTLEASYPIPFAYPQLETSIIAFFMLIIFSWLETFLLSSLSVAVTASKAFKLIGLRFVMSLALLGLVNLVHFSANQIYSNEDFWLSPCPYMDNEFSEDQIEFHNNAIYDCIKKRITETTLAALVTPIDQSLLLSANIMRPNTLFSFNDYSLNNALIWDNRLFVLRQCLIGILGIFIYLGTTWTILSFVGNERFPEQREECGT
jgi:hypothetical protein